MDQPLRAVNKIFLTTGATGRKVRFMGRRKASGPRLLAEEMAQRGATRRELADHLRVSVGSVAGWLRGDAVPGIGSALAIQEWADGRVPMESWVRP
jgi:hypothetical protein